MQECLKIKIKSATSGENLFIPHNPIILIFKYFERKNVEVFSYSSF